jgi:hypothetical protein
MYTESLSDTNRDQFDPIVHSLALTLDWLIYGAKSFYLFFFFQRALFFCCTCNNERGVKCEQPELEDSSLGAEEVSPR